MADRGTVIKASGNRAFIMNEHCQFLEIKRTAGLQPGDQIEYLPGDIVSPGRYPARALAVAASFIIVCLVAFTAFQHMLTGKVYAYIGMEINPSIEIGINSENKVISLKGYNDDGKRLIGSRDLLNRDIDEALRTIIRDCREGNYLSGKNGNDIAVSVNIPGGGDGRVLMGQVDTAAKNALAENGVSARIHYFSIDERTMEQAREQEVSPLKYMLWEEAGRLGYSIPLQSVSIRDPRIKEIAADKDEKVGSGDTAGSEAPPSEGQSIAVPAGKNGQGRGAGGQVDVPKEKGFEPDPGNGKPTEAGEKGAGRPEKESGQPGREVESPGAPGDDQSKTRGPEGRPGKSPEGKNTEVKGPGQPDKAVKPVSEDTLTEESAGSAEVESAGSQTDKPGTNGSVQEGNSSVSGGGPVEGSTGGGGSNGGSSGSGGSGGGSSDGGGKSGKGGHGGGGGSGGKGK